MVDYFIPKKLAFFFIAENDKTSHLDIRNLAAKYHETIKSKPIIFRVGDIVRNKNS